MAGEGSGKKKGGGASNAKAKAPTQGKRRASPVRPRQAGAFSSKTKTGQGKVQTSIAYDYHPGIRLPITVMKVDYGEELYEKVVQDLNLANELASSNKKGSNKQKENLKEAKEAVMKEDKCRDFSTPAFHSSSRVTNELAKALERLNTLPQDVACAFSKDERFQPLVIDRASKALRTPLDSEIFKELSPIQPNQNSKAEIAKTVCDQIKSVRPACRKKDPQPNILDHQTISYSRIKPGLPRFAARPPPKPPTSVSVDVRPSIQFNIIDSQQQFEREADVLK